MAYAGPKVTSSTTPVFEVSTLGGEFESAFRDAHPALGLAVLAELAFAATPFPLQLERFFSCYGLRWNENLESTLKTLLKTPPRFRDWVNERQLGARELAPLKAIKSDGSPEATEFFNWLTKKIGELNPSRSVGSQSLEWAVELFLMKEDPAEIFHETPATTADEWHLWLKEKRFSQRTQTREYMEQQLKSVSWPKGSKVSVFEAGDRMGFEIRLQASDVQDLTRKANTLTHSAAQLARGIQEDLQ